MKMTEPERVDFMIFSAETVVSNSDMIKAYKACRDKTEVFGKILIFKNNQPDAVLFSITEYERFSRFLEYLEFLNDEELSAVLHSLPGIADRRKHPRSGQTQFRAG